MRCTLQYAQLHAPSLKDLNCHFISGPHFTSGRVVDAICWYWVRFGSWDFWDFYALGHLCADFRPSRFLSRQIYRMNAHAGGTAAQIPSISVITTSSYIASRLGLIPFVDNLLVLAPRIC